MVSSRTFALRNLNQIATLAGAFKKDGRHLLPEDLGIIEKASLVANDLEILWVGPDVEFPKKFLEVQSFDLSGKVLTPEIVDCHTHLVFAGDRSSEYAMRLNGATYEEIAQNQGGILSTVRETRKASEEELYLLAKRRVEKIHSYGVGTLEIKSGYGLNFSCEKMISRVINRLKKEFAPRVQILSTFMAAHAIPPEYTSSKDYLKEIVCPLMRDMAKEKMIDAVDIFFEQGYFSRQDTENLFEEAKNLNLPVKAHVDEFQNHGGAITAVKYQALSADHLLCTDERGIQALANSETVSTLLPGTGFFLGKPQAKAREFLNAGNRVAIGSDYNPGSCHFDNVLFLASLAAPQYGMNQAELWASITLNAAKALGLSSAGTLQKGPLSRFSLFEAPSIHHITYHWGQNFAIPVSSIFSKISKM